MSVLSLDELRKLPDPQPLDAGIYFLWEGEELVYVGKSANLLERSARQHCVNRYASDRTYAERHTAIPHDRMTALVIESGRVQSPRLKYLLRDTEQEYIDAYQPRWNADDSNGGTVGTR